MNPIVARQLQLATEAAFAGTHAAYADAMSRLRTLDRVGDVDDSTLAALEIAARIRHGDVAAAAHAADRLRQAGNVELLDHLRQSLLRAPEASDSRFRAAVAALGVAPVVRTRSRRTRQMALLAAVVLACGVGAFAIMAWFDRGETFRDSAVRDFTVVSKSVGMVVVRANLRDDNGVVRRVPVAVGTGFVVSPQGFVLTNRHVIDLDEGDPDVLPPSLRDSFAGWDVVFVLPEEPPRVLNVIVGRKSRATDLALLRVPSAVDLPPALEFANSPGIGEQVFAIGFPSLANELAFALSPGATENQMSRLLKDIKEGDVSVTRWLPDGELVCTVTAGIVSAKRYTEMGLVLQSDVFVHHGNSGGPLLNADGRVIGVNTGKHARTESVNAAISSYAVWRELFDIPAIRWPDDWGADAYVGVERTLR